MVIFAVFTKHLPIYHFEHLRKVMCANTYCRNVLKLTLWHHIVQKHENLQGKCVFKANNENPTKGEFSGHIKTNIEIIGQTCYEEISLKFIKTQLKAFNIKHIIEESFMYLKSLQRKHNK